MAFLDNSGNIILDAVLTDTGRYRLAKGDGSFKIQKFALGDDEIVYSQYNKSHASGSAYYDLSILQTPVLEAFTNNTSTMNSKLITIPRTNLLYLPVIKINDLLADTQMHSSGTFMVAVDKDTETSFSTIDGVMMGETLNGSETIRLDQGLDTTEISYAFTIDSDLVETQYIIEIDNRFGKIVGTKGTVARMSFIDDDSIASYYLSLGTDQEFVVENTNRNSSTNEVIAGPRGTTLQFRIQASLDLNTSTYLFEQLGTTRNMYDGDGALTNIYYIDSYVRISGATTGFRIDIPVRFIKDV
jgi:hypothetical protein